MWKWETIKHGWQPASHLPKLVAWLVARKHSHVDWLEDYSKYVDIRFDSRTGDFIVRHDTDDTCLVWKD